MTNLETIYSLPLRGGFMKMVSIFFITLYAINCLADILVVEGRPYDYKPAQLKMCGSEGDSLYHAEKLLISAAKTVGELTADAACKAGTVELCSQDAKTKHWVSLLFHQIRQYPSRFRSTGCFSLREQCESLCESAKIYSKDDCHIECNQYESYNK